MFFVFCTRARRIAGGGLFAGPVRSEEGLLRAFDLPFVTCCGPPGRARIFLTGDYYSILSILQVLLYVLLYYSYRHHTMILLYSTRSTRMVLASPLLACCTSYHIFVVVCVQLPSLRRAALSMIYP